MFVLTSEAPLGLQGGQFLRAALSIIGCKAGYLRDLNAIIFIKDITSITTKTLAIRIGGFARNVHYCADAIR